MENVDVGIISQIIKEWGVVAVLVWYIYYTQTKTIPSLVQAFKEEIKAERDKHEDVAASIIAAINKLSDTIAAKGISKA